MAMPVGTACAAPGVSTTRSSAQQVHGGVFVRTVGVAGKDGVGVQFLDSDFHWFRNQCAMMLN